MTPMLTKTARAPRPTHRCKRTLCVPEELEQATVRVRKARRPEASAPALTSPAHTTATVAAAGSSTTAPPSQPHAPIPSSSKDRPLATSSHPNLSPSAATTATNGHAAPPATAPPLTTHGNASPQTAKSPPPPPPQRRPLRRAPPRRMSAPGNMLLPSHRRAASLNPGRDHEVPPAADVGPHAKSLRPHGSHELLHKLHAKSLFRRQRSASLGPHDGGGGGAAAAAKTGTRHAHAASAGWLPSLEQALMQDELSHALLARSSLAGRDGDNDGRAGAGGWPLSRTASHSAAERTQGPHARDGHHHDARDGHHGHEHARAPVLRVQPAKVRHPLAGLDLANHHHHQHHHHHQQHHHHHHHRRQHHDGHVHGLHRDSHPHPGPEHVQAASTSQPGGCARRRAGAARCCLTDARCGGLWLG